MVFAYVVLLRIEAPWCHVRFFVPYDVLIKKHTEIVIESLYIFASFSTKRYNQIQQMEMILFFYAKNI